MNENQRTLLDNWHIALRTAQRANYRAASRSEMLNYWLGIPVVVLATIVGTSVFGTLGERPDQIAQIAVGTLSVLSAILSAIHTSLRYSERAEKHRSAATSYASLQKELTQKLAAPPTDEGTTDTWITAFRLSWDTIAKEAPTVPRKVWERTLQEEVDAAKARAKKAGSP